MRFLALLLVLAVASAGAGGLNIVWAQNPPSAGSTSAQDEGMTLVAQKIDPAQAQAPASPPQPQAAGPKKKKKLPIFLQPFEFVISAVVHTIIFWDKGD